MQNGESKNWMPVLMLLVVSALTSMQLIGLSKIIMFLLSERKIDSTNSSKERLLLVNRLMSKDPMTFQILNQSSEESSLSEFQQVRNDDESEIAKSDPNQVWYGNGEVIVDLDQDYRDLGLISDD